MQCAYALDSTNTRPDFIKLPVVVDNKKEVDNIIKRLSDLNLVEYYMNEAESSKWKFYRFLDVKFHVYEMNTPIGKINNYLTILNKVQMRKH